jgi:hypothetical protein
VQDRDMLLLLLLMEKKKHRNRTQARLITPLIPTTKRQAGFSIIVVSIIKAEKYSEAQSIPASQLMTKGIMRASSSTSLQLRKHWKCTLKKAEQIFLI